MKKGIGTIDFKSRVSNFWHYHWKIIVCGVLVLGVVVFLLVDYLVKPVDVKIVVLSRNESVLDLSKIHEVLIDYTPDRNGDNIINLEIHNISPSNSELSDEEFVLNSISRLQDRETYLYLIDSELFDLLEKQPDERNIPEGFVNFSEENPNNPYVKGKGYNVIGSPFQEGFGISDELAEKYFESGLLLVLRAPVTEYSLTAGGDVEMPGYFQADAMMRYIVRGTPVKRID
ncbi:MAG: hypothetical protein ACOX6U_02845 [Oscillospiraceae bacterium]